MVGISSLEKRETIMGFKFVHAADIHLDSPLRGLERYEGAPLEAMRSATRRAFEKLIEMCIDEEAAFLLLVGDLYDGQWRDYNTSLYFIQQLNRLRKANVNVFIVLGNHDADSTIARALNPPDHVKIFRSAKPETFQLSYPPVAIHGQSYAQAEVTEDLSAGFPRAVSGLFNIGMLHTNADGAATGHKPYAPCSVRSLVDKGYQYWALGHVHQRTELASDPPVIFPGNLQGRHIREAGPKGATLVTVDDDLRPRAEHRDLDVMRWHLCRVEVENAETPEVAIDRAVEAIEALRRTGGDLPFAVRMHLTGRCGAHQLLVLQGERWAHELRSRAMSIDGIWLEKIRFDTQTKRDLSQLRTIPGPLATLLRCFDEHRNNPEALRSLAQELLPVRKALSGIDDDTSRFDDDAGLRVILDSVEQMLVPMLLEGGHSQ